MKTKLPKSFKQYFWDVDFEQLDYRKHKRYIAVRLLEHGDIKATKWILITYGKDLIREVVTKYRGLSPKTANFWALFSNIDLKKVPSLQNPYNRLPWRSWTGI